MSTEAAENRAPAFLRVGQPFQTASAICRTSARRHPRKPAWIPDRRRRREAACLRCAGRTERRVRSEHRRHRHRGRHRRAFWSRAVYPGRGLHPGPIHRGFRASLRDRSHHDLAMKLGSTPMSTGERVQQPREELFACESPFGVVRRRAQAFPAAIPAPWDRSHCDEQAPGLLVPKRDYKALRSRKPGGCEPSTTIVVASA
jgi:hypothetical protein